MAVDEALFEAHVAGWLVEHGGYQQPKVGNASADFDPVRGLDLVELFAFIEATQAQAWQRRVATAQHAGIVFSQVSGTLRGLRGTGQKRPPYGSGPCVFGHGG